MSHAYLSNHDFSSLRLGHQKVPVSILTASTSIGSLSGSTILVASTTGLTLSLPSPQQGLKYDIFISSTAASHSLVAPSASLVGSVLPATATAGVAMFSGAAKTSLTSSAGSAVGDNISVVSDGSKWFVKGSSSAFNAFVFA